MQGGNLIMKFKVKKDIQIVIDGVLSIFKKDNIVDLKEETGLTYNEFFERYIEPPKKKEVKQEVKKPVIEEKPKKEVKVKEETVDTTVKKPTTDKVNPKEEPVIEDKTSIKNTKKTETKKTTTKKSDKK